MDGHTIERGVSLSPPLLTDPTERVAVVVHDPEPLGLTVAGRETRFFSKRAGTEVTLRFFIDPDLITKDEVEIGLRHDGGTRRTTLRVSETARTGAARLVETRNAKARWLRGNTRCPECQGALVYDGVRATCAAGHVYDQRLHCINLLSSRTGAETKLSGGEFVSRHRLSRFAMDVIEDARSRGGMVLDMGAGLKFPEDCLDNVINLEVEAYPTTDIVAAGQKLPFPDGTFDGIFCFAVLEHVSDPFSCAAEMARVLKPGGQLCVGVPFIFEEHGYPEHYYNMTRRGLANLFEDRLTVTRQAPGRLSLPALIKKYMSNLPPDMARQVGALTLEQIADAPMDKALAMTRQDELSPELRWRFALGTYLWATKSH